MDKEALIAQGFTSEQADIAISAHNEAIKNNFVPLSVHNEIRAELKKEKETVAERDAQITKLGTDVGSVEDLKAQVKKLEADNAESATKYASELAKERQMNNLRNTISGEVHDADYVLSLIDFDAVKFDADNKVVSGFKEQYEKIKQDKAFVVKEAKVDEPTFIPKGVNGGQGKSTIPGKESFAGENFAKGIAKSRIESTKNDKANYFGE